MLPFPNSFQTLTQLLQTQVFSALLSFLPLVSLLILVPIPHNSPFPQLSILFFLSSPVLWFCLLTMAQNSLILILSFSLIRLSFFCLGLRPPFLSFLPVISSLAVVVVPLLLLPSHPASQVSGDGASLICNFPVISPKSGGASTLNHPGRRTLALPHPLTCVWREASWRRAAWGGSAWGGAPWGKEMGRWRAVGVLCVLREGTGCLRGKVLRKRVCVFRRLFLLELVLMCPRGKVR